MGIVIRRFRSVFFVLTCAVVTSAAPNTKIHGVVTDDAGKPVRGAMVKAITDGKTWARFTQDNGQYEITVPAGSYSVSAEAFGYHSKRESLAAGQADELNFKLAPGVAVGNLTSAEIVSLLPDNADTRYIRAECSICHSFSRISHKSGYTAADWMSFIPTMPRGRAALPDFPPNKLAKLTSLLEKDFGPNAPIFGPNAAPPKAEQVQHAELSNAVLNATIREFPIPTGMDAMPICVLVDNRGDVWFSERGLHANKYGRFEVSTEKFFEYPSPQPHQGAIGKDGTIWMASTNGLKGPDLTGLDPETGKIVAYTIPSPRVSNSHTHTMSVDSKGDLWFSGDTVRKFDIKTKQFVDYKVPFPKTFPKNSINYWVQDSTDTRPLYIDSYYDVKVDSKDQVWASTFAYGNLVRVNPATGETKSFHAPDTPTIRGIDVDADDNIWFGGYDGNALGKLDPKTGAFKMYHPPTKYAMPYGIAVDKKTGNVWFADINGNHVTRFNPKTEHFDEFPIPSADAIPRFIALDSKGRVWFAEFMNGKIGYVDPGGDSKSTSSK